LKSVRNLEILICLKAVFYHFQFLKPYFQWQSLLAKLSDVSHCNNTSLLALATLGDETQNIIYPFCLILPEEAMASRSDKLFGNIISVFANNFANVNEPLTIFSLAKCPCYNATISYGGCSFYFLPVSIVPEAVFLVMSDPSMNKL
jgi:hypothetical protein